MANIQDIYLEHYNTIDLSKSTSEVAVNDQNDCVKKLETRNGYFMLFQTLFALSFVHMDKLPYHIESICGLIVLFMTSRLNRFKIASGNIYMFVFSILSLLGCVISDSGHDVKIVEGLFSMTILTIEQLSFVDKDLFSSKQKGKNND